MKKLIATVISLIMMNTAHADDSAKLHMKISGPVHDNRYFLCVTNAGCISVAFGDTGKVYPMDGGKIDNIFIANGIDRSMYPQPLPSSCDISVNNGQTLNVTGQLAVNGRKVTIKNLHCTVS